MPSRKPKTGAARRRDMGYLPLNTVIGSLKEARAKDRKQQKLMRDRTLFVSYLLLLKSQRHSVEEVQAMLSRSGLTEENATIMLEHLLRGDPNIPDPKKYAPVKIKGRWTTP